MSANPSYEQLIKKVGSSNFSLDEKMIINEAIKKMYNEYEVAAAGIAKIVSLTADKPTYEKISQVIASAKERVDSGKPALSTADKKLLEKALGQKIIRTIEMGDSTFLYILQNQIASRQSVQNEIDTLTSLLEKQDTKTKNWQ